MINYLEYSYGSNKGKTSVGDLIENPFARGQVDTDFTANKVDESKTFDSATTSIALQWGPVVPGTVTFKVGTDNYLDDGNGKIYKYADGATVSVVTNLVTESVDPNNGHLEGVAPRIVKTITGATEAGSIVYGNAATKGVGHAGVEQIYDTTGPTITLTTGITGAVTFAYNYNNVVIPQNDLPIVTAEMKGMPLLAKARRVAIYFSQIAAFQAKQDYGFDLQDALSQRAVAELNYEVDTEIVNLLVATAKANTSGAELAELTFDRTVPVGISMAQHFESFADIIEAARQIIYVRTQKFSPNYMLIAPDVLRVVSFLNGFKPAEGITRVNGPYQAGTYNGIKIFVSPSIAAGEFAFGLNGDDMLSSAAVYAPYLPILPTSLLQYADGGTTQGLTKIA